MNPKIEKAVCQTAGFLQDVDFFFSKAIDGALCALYPVFLNTDQAKNRFNECENGRWKCEGILHPVIQCSSTP